MNYLIISFKISFLYRKEHFERKYWRVFNEDVFFSMNQFHSILIFKAKTFNLKGSSWKFQHRRFDFNRQSQIEYIFHWNPLYDMIRLYYSMSDYQYCVLISFPLSLEYIDHLENKLRLIIPQRQWLMCQADQSSEQPRKD